MPYSQFFEAKIAKNREREIDIKRELRRWTLPNAPFAGVGRGTLRKDYSTASLEAIDL